jgi:5-formyltetrahydrofolate cyclo-ligase
MDDTIRQHKALLRQTMRELRAALDPEERAAKSLLIKSHLFSIPEVMSAASLMFYVSFSSEVQTEPMIRHALSLGKQVIVPLTDMKNKRLQLSYLKDFDNDLAPGTWGISEPKPDKIRPVDYRAIDVVVTPGLAFSEQGFRLGYGGGFYDRLLRESGKKAYALCFEMQMLPEVPCIAGQDVRVNCIVTEKRIIKCDNMGNNKDRLM